MNTKIIVVSACIASLLWISWEHAEVTPSIVRVYNKTQKPIYGALYSYQSEDTQYEQQSPGVAIQAGKYYSMLVHGTYTTPLYLLFSTDKKRLSRSISPAQMQHTFSKPIAKNIYIAKKKGVLKGYDSHEWRLLKEKDKKKPLNIRKKVAQRVPLKQAKAVYAELSDKVQDEIRAYYSHWWNTPHKKKVASVRSGTDLSRGEKTAQQKRINRAKQALKKKLEKDPQRVPRIAVVISGGGYRAMVMTLGLLVGLEKAGLLDYVTWISSISGSTWGVAPLYAYMAQNPHASIEQFRSKQFQSIADKPLKPEKQKAMKLINDLLLVEACDDQPFTSANLFGALLANRLLTSVDRNPQRIYLSEQASMVERGTLPIPIYTAAATEKGVPKSQLGWFEYTPWEIGSTWLKQYVPTWGFGRTFHKGKSVTFALEKSLGFHLATWGSLFSMLFKQAYETIGRYVPNTIAKNIIQDIISQQVESNKVGWAEVANYTYGIPESAISKRTDIDLIDAGLLQNMPFAPFEKRPKRSVDMFICYDASQDLKDGVHLKKAVASAEQNELNLPPITYTGAHKKALSIFKDEKKKDMPVIAYMPGINDPKLHTLLEKPAFSSYKSSVKNFDLQNCIKSEFCKTTNFDYNHQELLKLSTVVEFTVRAVADELFAEIESLAISDKKKKKKPGKEKTDKKDTKAQKETPAKKKTKTSQKEKKKPKKGKSKNS